MWEQDIKIFVAVNKLTEQQLHFDVSVACAAVGVPLVGFWAKYKSPLEKVPLKTSVSVYKFILHVYLETSMAVHEMVLQHLKVCGHGFRACILLTQMCSVLLFLQLKICNMFCNENKHFLYPEVL